MENNYTIAAKQIVLSYFEALAQKECLNAEGFQELFALKLDEDNKILLEHCKAMKIIMERAIKEIEGSE